MPKPNTSHNPFGLTDNQVVTMDVMLRLTCSKKAAAELGVTHTTVNQAVRRAAAKMQARTWLEAFLMWDRLRRTPTTFKGRPPVNSVFSQGRAP